jgi:hypothetical protein
MTKVRRAETEGVTAVPVPDPWICVSHAGVNALGIGTRYGACRPDLPLPTTNRETRLFILPRRPFSQVTVLQSCTSSPGWTSRLPGAFTAADAAFGHS